MKKCCFSKRDVVFGILILYLLVKVYVISTPTPNDDSLPDELKNTLIQMASN